MTHPSSTASDTSHEGGALAPLKHTVFLVLWIATVVSNVGTWMQNAAAGWLMTSLTSDAFIVSMVQVATMLPVVLLGLPAGAFADIFDRRTLLIIVNVAAALIVAVLAMLVGWDMVTPVTLLVFTALVGASAALIAPAWQAIVPSLVPRANLQAAISLNSVGVNISRAIGPALAGLLIGLLGMSAPFWINAASTVGVVLALIWWKPAAATGPQLPPERLGSALRVGLRHARHNPHLTATLVRAFGFFVFASSYWALLPLLARDQIAGGPQLYGMLLGTIGAGAVAGAFLLPALKSMLGPDRLVAAATVATAVALVLFGLAETPLVAFVACLLAGLSWIAVLAPINVSAQVGLPPWIKGRGLALFATVQFGAMAGGSAIWGQVAKHYGLPFAHFLAAAGAVLGIALLWRWKLGTAANLDLTPSMHWPAPLLATDVAPDRGPVLVTIEYEIDEAEHEAFMAAVLRLRPERLRDGAFEWRVYQDAADPRRFVETFAVASWQEHQRQHHRVSQADREVQDDVRRFHKGSNAPIVRHLLAAEAQRLTGGSE